jgi:transcriptional regulator with XRE-family HTH domain
MKMKVGHRLFTAREERKLTQAEMAELLNVSPSTYARIERNETSLEIDIIANIAKTLQIPIQEFLPDTISVNNSSLDNNQNAQSLVLGNIYNYNYSDKEIESEMKLKDKEIEFLKEKNSFLEKEIENLKEINGFLREKTK